MDLRNQKDDSTQALIDKFQMKSKAGRVIGILPIGVEFPAFGPSTYLFQNSPAKASFQQQNSAINETKRRVRDENGNFFALVLIISTIAMAQSQKGGGLPFPDSGGSLCLFDEYNRLLELASNHQKARDATQNYSIQCAELKFRVENQSVLGAVQLEGEVFKKGVTKVPLTSRHDDV